MHNAAVKPNEKPALENQTKNFRRFFRLGMVIPVVFGLGCFSQTKSAIAAEPDGAEFSVLVYSETAGFRHGSIPYGIRAIQKLGEEHNFKVEDTKDSAAFTPENLERFAVIVFNNTTGTLFNEEQRQALKGFIRNGGGYVGIHAATDTEYDWAWYGRLSGAYFAGHPHVQEAVIDVEIPDHPSTKHLSETWVRTDEWYNFRENPRDNVKVLLALDTDSFEGSTMENDHPIAWYHEFDGGRAWYTGGGHTNESFQEPDFVQHILGGILWAAGKED